MNTRLFCQGYASVFNIRDSHCDIMGNDAFSPLLYGQQQSNIKLLWQHKQEEPLGIVKDFTCDSYGLLINFSLPLQLNNSKKLLTLLQEGVQIGLSIGYVVNKYFVNNVQNT